MAARHAAAIAQRRTNANVEQPATERRPNGRRIIKKFCAISAPTRYAPATELGARLIRNYSFDGDQDETNGRRAVRFAKFKFLKHLGR